MLKNTLTRKSSPYPELTLSEGFPIWQTYKIQFQSVLFPHSSTLMALCREALTRHHPHVLHSVGMSQTTHRTDVWAYQPEEPLIVSKSGPLSGLTFSIKDLFGVADWPLKASTQAPVPQPEESPLVRRLLELGAAAVGKTHLHEIALGITGANGFGGTKHSVLLDRIPGGSSSGAAVSVALGEVDFALGTDTGGSIRVPAAWCGVYGFKPTKGHPAWPTDGVLPLSATCDHSGPLAKDFKTIVHLQETLTKEALPQTSWTDKKVGLWLPEGWVDQNVWEAVQAFAAHLKSLGASLYPIQLPEMMDAYTPIVLAEAAEVHAEALKLEQPGFTPFTEAALRRGADISTAELEAAFECRQAYGALLKQHFSAVDVLLAPVVPTLPPPFGQDEIDLHGQAVSVRQAVLRINSPFSMLGFPAVALPSQQEFIGVQLVAPHQQDQQLLALVSHLA